MSIKKYIFAILIFFISVPLFSVNYYSDSVNGFSGYAGAGLWPSLNQADLEQSVLRTREFLQIKGYNGYRLRFIGNCYKLTKKEIFLMWSALHEYELSNEETYCVYIVGDSKILCIFAVIKENGKSCDWYSIGYFEFVEQ